MLSLEAAATMAREMGWLVERSAKGVDSKVHPKGRYERRRTRARERERKGGRTSERGSERKGGRKEGRERESAGEFTSPGEFLQDLISRARARAFIYIRTYARVRA